MRRSSERSLRVEGFSQPTGDMPYYHARCRVRSKEGMQITGARWRSGGGEGRAGRYVVLASGERMEEGLIPARSEAEVLVRCDWRPGKSYEVGLEWKLAGQEEVGEALTATGECREEGGYWDGRWKNYRPVVVRETQGLDREQEPVDVSVAFAAGDVTDLARELRMVEVDPETGKQEEIPCQPYAITPYQPAEENRGQASVRCNIAFLATVPAKGTKIYLAFVGNPQAGAPAYESDLEVAGEGEGKAWENSAVRYQFQKGSGQLLEVLLKTGVEKAIRHSRGGGMAMHWNPDCYSLPRPWAYTHHWNIPETGQMREIRGPIFVQSTRWGALEPNMPEVMGWVTYRLYRQNPELRMTSLMEVVEDIEVEAVRNDEMVVDSDLVSHYALEEKDGRIRSGALEGEANKEHRWIGPLSLDIPWVCLYDPKEGYGFASVRVRHDFGHRYGEPAVTDKAGTYIHYASGSIAYWFRAYVLELWEPRPLVLGKGAYYSETNAYLPCRMDGGKESLEWLRGRAGRLRHPLLTSSGREV